MKITLLQLNPRDDKQENLASVASLATEAIKASAPRVLSLPEAWMYLGGPRDKKQSAAEEFPSPEGGEGGPAYALMQNLAREHGIYVHGGSIAQRDGEKLKNTTLVFDPDGKEIARYSKIHMYDVVLPNGQVNRESDTNTPGDAIVTCDIDGMTVGLAICYDLRFPELFRALRDRGAELVFLPAAFRLLTGTDHWHALIRARAIETQCWFAAAGTSGLHFNAQGEAVATYGHSLICDPWGTITAEASRGVGFVTGRLDRTLTQAIRRDFPLEEQRRLPL